VSVEPYARSTSEPLQRTFEVQAKPLLHQREHVARLVAAVALESLIAVNREVDAVLAVGIAERTVPAV
jgi:hypothetical protein